MAQEGKKPKFGDIAGSNGNLNIRGNHIVYFESRVLSEAEEKQKDVTTAPNYYVWLCLVSEYVFWLLRDFCFWQTDFKEDNLVLGYKNIIELFCQKFREFSSCSGNDLKELYDILVKFLYLRHSMIHNGFPGILPAGIKSSQKRKLPKIPDFSEYGDTFEQNEAKKIIRWFSRPANFQEAKAEFLKIVNAASRGEEASVDFGWCLITRNQ